MLVTPWRLELELLRYRFPEFYREPIVVVSISRQRLYLWASGSVDQEFPVSTSKFGVGSEEGSLKTPLGVHRIVAKIGAGVAEGTVFEGRRNTHRVAEIMKDSEAPGDRDLITTRILQLEGLEVGINRGRGIDSLERYIYLHGTPEEGLLGRPASIGCIRMGNRAVAEVFDRVPESGLVLISGA